MVKMTKVAIKILYVILVFSMVLAVVNPVFAIKPNDITAREPSGTDIKDFAGKVLGVLQVIGVCVAVVIVVVIGIKYLMGSAEEKAEYKKTMIPYVVGAALVAMGPSIANAVYTAFSA